MIDTRAKIVSSIELMPHTFKIALLAPEIATRAIPGQFLMIQSDGFTLRRPVSIHNVIENRIIELLVRIAGQGTASIACKKEGEALDIIGPLGNGFNLEDAGKKILIMAGGIGIAPLYFLSTAALRRGINVSLLLGARSKEQVLPVKLFPRGTEVILSTEDGSLGHRGMITDVAIPYLSQCDKAFACGPLPMYHRILQIIDSNNIKTTVEVSLEVRMGCGFGICYGCSIKTKSGMKQVCRDGPVFSLDQIDLGWVRT
jgi:dihydroorotate dehydrogenase electron transfer subunit